MCVRWQSCERYQTEEADAVKVPRLGVGGIGQNLDSDEIGNSPREKQYKKTSEHGILRFGGGEECWGFPGGPFPISSFCLATDN